MRRRTWERLSGFLVPGQVPLGSLPETLSTGRALVFEVLRAAFEPRSGARGAASLIFLRFRAETLTFIRLIPPLSCGAQTFLFKRKPARVSPARETRGCAVGNPVVVFLSPLGSTALSSEVSGGACLSHHPQSLGCSSWAFVEPLSGEPWVDIEMVSCRGKVTHWPLSVTGENALPVAKQSGVRP